MEKTAKIFATAAFLAGCLPFTVVGAGLSVTPNGDQGVLMVSSDVTGAQSARVTFDYDQTLGEPWVSVQGGNLTSPVQISQGRVTVAIDRDDPDAAIELDVRFETLGNMSRAISNISAVTVDGGGAQTPVPVEFAQPDPAPQPGEGDGGTRESGQIQGDKREPLRQAAAADSTAGPDADRPLAAQEAREEKGRAQQPDQPARATSVLQLFALFRGEPGLDAFIGLFAQGRAAGMRQEPAIAISDGKAQVKLVFSHFPEGNQAPNFALVGADLVGLEKDPGGGWTVTAVAKAGAHEASLLLMGPGETSEFPLIVAPRLANLPAAPVRAGNFLAELNQYLAADCGKAGEPPPRHLCEYIFTANILAQTK